MSNCDLKGRTALVVGASRGIGLATAQAFAAAGADVILTSRSAQSAEAAATQVGGTAIGVGVHALDEDGARRCIDNVVDQFGGLDILVNNAGTNPAHGRLAEQDHGRFSKTFDVNLWAPMLWSDLASKAWMMDNGGAIVNTASLGGMVAEKGIGVYNASKAALIHLTKQLAMELAPAVRVNAVAPGVVRTKLAEALWVDQEHEVAAATPLGRIGEPDDVASAILFLASDAARWITGETLVVDGGQLLGDIRNFAE
ncbi:SDR family oxidoreductase (plasmid) [Rhodococcus sp. ZPP]|uniref:SDR family oxidoreductase n=1 Tax=Rhodococcus sp. ZPP TaxID=2749906 RepID=UPI001AD895C8|nr:SDR family oxidoreductase [Rhodococcus sp. ZPP]QTJ70672.1 SDR family oxidoreductase [Rhodococcus sp. ZPP]